MKYNMNFDWKFSKAVVPFPLAAARESIAFQGKDFSLFSYDDSSFSSVSVPHCPNAEDSFDSLIRDAGEATLYRGFMFYRKTFSLTEISDKKFFLEFEAVRQSIYLYINEQFVGSYEAGTAPVGFDITPFVEKGENLIALATDNAAYRECEFVTLETRPGNTPGDCSGERHQWNQKDFNEVQGGITGNVNLYVTPLVYQTRPLYNNLKTTGNYIYPSDFDFSSDTATVNIRAEVRNESAHPVTGTLYVKIKDGDKVISTFSSEKVTIPPAQDSGVVLKSVVPSDAYDENPAPTNSDTVDVFYINASQRISSLTFWSIDNPHLYDVEITLSTNAFPDDVQTITTGFRHVTYDIKKGGLLINNESVYLKGYAQRSTNEWAVIGVANDYLSDFDMKLVRQSGADYIRWMHVTPKPVMVRACDKYGVVCVCPAGDKEADTIGRQWDMRMEAMRDAIIYFRNSPSVIFYEAGNAAITGEHMREMTLLKNSLDPSGFRFMGCRSLTTPEQIREAEWVGTMVYRYDAHAKKTMDELDYHIPMLETEYKRDESPRRVWDDYSPPYYDYVNKWLGDGAKKTDGYDVWDQTQEEFAVFAASEKDGYAYFFNNRIDGPTLNNYYSGAAIMVWSDSNMHGRNSGSENCRTTGKVDPVRIPKQAFYALRAMHSDGPMVHILGHWNYPPDTDENYNYRTKEWNGLFWEYTDNISRRNPHKKTVFVAASLSCERVELYINGILSGVCAEPLDNYIYPFPDIDITKHGYIEAVAYDYSGKRAATHRIDTAGEKKKISLSLTTGPEGFIADGSDICFIDVSITDENGNVCPLADDKISFSLEGDGVFLGGYNSGTYDETSVIHKSYCFAECGTNRVFVKSTLHGKKFALTASAEGLEGASVTCDMKDVSLANGLSTQMQQSYKKNTFRYIREKSDNITRTNKASVYEKDIYTVYVNKKPSSLSSPAYRPDSSTGVLCPVGEVLKALGIPYTYSYNIHGKLTLNIMNISLTDGETTIRIGGETNLTNAEFYVENGEIIAEIAAVMAYFKNVEIVTDASTKSVYIDFLEQKR